jgi:hypothetical protein
MNVFAGRCHCGNLSVRDRAKLSRYSWGRHTAEFLVCRDCGRYLGQMHRAPDGCATAHPVLRGVLLPHPPRTRRTGLVVVRERTRAWVGVGRPAAEADAPRSGRGCATAHPVLRAF